MKWVWTSLGGAAAVAIMFATGMWLEVCRINALPALSVEGASLWASMAAVLGLPALIGLALVGLPAARVLGGSTPDPVRAGWLQLGLGGGLVWLGSMAIILRNTGIYPDDYFIAVGWKLATVLVVLRYTTALLVTAMGGWATVRFGPLLTARLRDALPSAPARVAVHTALIGTGLALLYSSIVFASGVYFMGRPLGRVAELAFGTPSPHRTTEQYAGPTQAPRKKLIILGIDGMGFRQIDRMVADGDLPTVQRLRAEGTSGYLQTYKPTSSPLIWSTLGTGFAPEAHGVTGYIQYHFPGVQRPLFAPMARGINKYLTLLDEHLGLFDSTPVLGTGRTEKALWEIVDLHGGTSSVIGWWPTRPVDPVAGFMVSDFGVRELAPELGKPDAACDLSPADVTPATLCAELTAARVLQPHDRPYCEGDYQARGTRPDTWPEALDCLGANGKATMAVAMHIEQQHDVDFSAVYIHDADVHMAYEHFEPAYFRTVDSSSPQRDEIRNRYHSIDRLIAHWMEQVDEDTTLMVISDHAMVPVLYESKKTASHINAPPGVIFLWGPGIQAGKTLQGASVYDVVPTSLALMGLPVPETLQGRVLSEGMRPELAAAVQAGTVPDYGPRSRTSYDAATPEDHTDFMNELKALGYVE